MWSVRRGEGRGGIRGIEDGDGYLGGYYIYIYTFCAERERESSGPRFDCVCMDVLCDMYETDPILSCILLLCLCSVPFSLANPTCSPARRPQSLALTLEEVFPRPTPAELKTSHTDLTK